ncbi:polar amino acid transport system substrate-binding protein [Dethiosulfatibacter aminovorans DSM 17477]|uniref:histidine kinase n=1 Tax=Dethiosulfatibacter aminovorans DSM 17477 TaxID=1121476 RepID=A0A1M6IHH1_9FIRM|nr:transporter substrate-binding domain-containing protein [Dethiosulfatibacter aminovorans]SHJ33873.1 polar amino acid transport system substrate-binding protein [Dethiosulfatibacter aminovorans DSM 17477]
MNNKKAILIAIGVFILFISLNVLFQTRLGQFITSDLLKNDDLSTEEQIWLENKGELIYGADENSPPLMFVDEETSQYTGFTIDYVNAMSLEIGNEIKTKSYVWEEALNKLAAGETDFCDMFPSKERGKIFDFSEPIYTLKSILIVNSDNEEIKTIQDLRGRTVAIPRSDYGVEFLKERVQDINFIYTDNIEEAIKEILKGNADAVLGDEPNISYYIKKHNLYNNIKTLDNAVYESEVVLAVKKGNSILLSILNKGIRRLENKQTIPLIQQKWFGLSGDLKKESISEIIILLTMIFFVIIFITMYISYRWNRSLKYQVDLRTEELTVSREKLRITFDSITEYIFVLDNDGEIMDVNAAFMDYINLDNDTISGRKLYEFFDTEISDKIKSIIKETLIRKEGLIKEANIKGRIYNVKTFPFKKNSLELNRVIMMVEDITKERIMENQMLHSSKMAAIGQLASGVAHEIRNPLGLIRNYAYLIEKKVSKNDEVTRKALDVIEDSVERTSSIIDNLLNFSRIFGDKNEDTNIQEFIEDIVNLERSFFEKNNIDCKVICSDDLNIVINRESFKHIIINLIGNASDAMPEGGTLTLSAEKCDDGLVFKCIDTGIGIDKESINSIFNPFYTKKLKGKGTGLGLYIVYNEIEKNGGNIKVESEVNVGTTFTLELPALSAV